jgi:hypothetical protein
MNRRCPLCDQELPQGLDEHKLHAKMCQLVAPEITKEAKRLVEKESADLRCKLELEHKQRQRELERHARLAERKREREHAKALKEGAKQAKLAGAQQNEAKLERLQTQLNQDRARHRREKEQLLRTIEGMQRKLDTQTSEQRGNQAEVNLLAELKAAFPGDRIEPVPTGVKGADIIHHIMDGSTELGRIVYESKNVSTWQNAFVSKAKGYQTQYDTPYVMIVSRVFPKKKRSLCIQKDIPVVEPRMAIALAQILRDGVVEIGRLHLANAQRNGKAQELFNYVLSNEFATRFRQIQTCVDELRDQQKKEREWHEDAWQKEDKLFGQIDSRRREIETRIKNITREPASSNGRFKGVGAASS